MAANAGSEAPEIGSDWPAFLLPDNESRFINSTEFLQAGPLVVSFNRGHWCRYCLLELLALSEIYSEITSLGGDVVSIMPDNAARVREAREAFEIPFKILTDVDNGYALACGLMISLGNTVRDIYLGLGRDLNSIQGNEGWFVPIPATFVIGRDGRVCGRFTHPDFRRRMAPDDILTTLRGIA